LTPAPPRPGAVVAVPGEALARLRALAARQRTSEQEVLGRVLEAGLAVEEGKALRVATERTHVAPQGEGWHVPPFEHVLEVYRQAGLAFPGSVVEARGAWFDRWRRPPPMKLEDVLGALRADCRRWLKQEERYVVSFAKWINSGREQLPAELLTPGPAKGREPSADERKARAAHADEQRKRHDPQAARVGLCWCDPCKANKKNKA
jgi:hypothetical protein